MGLTRIQSPPTTTLMSDLNKHTERAEAKRLARIAAIEAVAYLSLDEQRDALIDALVEVEAQIKSHAGRSSQTAGQKSPKIAPVGPSRPLAADAQEDGITELLKGVLRGAKGRALTASEIGAAIAKDLPDFEHRRVLRALTRIYQQKSKPLLRHGRKGNFRYALRGPIEATKTIVPTKSTPDTDDTLVDRVLVAIKAGPTKDYALLAQKLLGSAEGTNKIKIRNTIYYLHREEKLKKRPDGTWEAA
jgi:hypothetical protein